MTNFLKGGGFRNRYLIRATLTALTPFHIGDGGTTTRNGLVDEKASNREILVNSVVTDANGRAYIPGSSLRGALRDWLRRRHQNMTETVETSLKGTTKTPDQIVADVKSGASVLERLFGTQQNEGKLEVWDARCTSKVSRETDTKGQWCFWDKDRMTYVARSVAIDPMTGTAAEGRLYHYELVPPGAKFEAAFTAQNLDGEELRFLLDTLQGFNDGDDPVTLGALTKLDFGRFRIDGFSIYRLDGSNLGQWLSLAADERNCRAGYGLLLDNTFALAQVDLDKLLSQKPASQRKAPASHSETWTLRLETPLVIRSGGRFIWKNAAAKKTRNYRMEFHWDTVVKRNEDYYHVSDLYHSLKIDGSDLKPYYHVPSSSVRGALRSWALRKLLPQEMWDIGGWLKKLTKAGLQNKNVGMKTLDAILDLFGFAVEAGDGDVTREYTKAGRLKIAVTPFSASNAHKPAVDGDWNAQGNNFGPSNAARHVKPRNPLDRVTHEAKKGGLHNALEFSRGQEMTVTLTVKEPTDFDNRLLKRWEQEINHGEILLGGLTAVGRGRLSISMSPHSPILSLGI